MLRFRPQRSASSTTVGGCVLSATALSSSAARSTDWIVLGLVGEISVFVGIVFVIRVARAQCERATRIVHDAGAGHKGGSQRSAALVKTRIDTAVSAAAKSATTPRLSAAIAVGSLMFQIAWRPFESPSRP